MVKFNFFQKKYYSIIISPNEVSLLVLSVLNDSIIPLVKYEEKTRIFTEGMIDTDNLSKALVKIKKALRLQNQEIKAFVILNLPILFVQRFLFYPHETISLKETIENKIKQFIPINLNKYLWNYSISPIQKNYVYVFFYKKDNLSEITYALLSSKILPIKITHILYSVFDFVKNNFSIYFENSYHFYIIHKNILTSALYEAGMLRNIYSESLTQNVNDVLKRLIQNNINDSNLPLDIIYIISDIDLELSDNLTQQQYKIVNINEITHLTPEEISSTNIIWNFIFKKENPLYELKIISLNKEFLLHELTSSLKMLTIGAFISFLIINFTIFAISKGIEDSNKIIEKQQLFAKTIETDKLFEEINQLSNSLNQLINIRERYIEKIEKIYYNLKNYNINQGVFTKESAKLIIEVQDPNKREEIKNQIKQIYPQAQINLLFNGLEVNFNNY